MLFRSPELVATGLPAGGYANGFTGIPKTFLPGKTKDQVRTREDLDPQAYAEFALGWVKGGAAIVGGCCEVGPAHIARLRDGKPRALKRGGRGRGREGGGGGRIPRPKR